MQLGVCDLVLEIALAKPVSVPWPGKFHSPSQDPLPVAAWPRFFAFAKPRLANYSGSLDLDYVLGLTVQDFLERRLQTLVFKHGLAKSIHHARVMIRQRHVAVGQGDHFAEVAGFWGLGGRKVHQGVRQNRYGRHYENGQVLGVARPPERERLWNGEGVAMENERLSGAPARPSRAASVRIPC